MFIIFLDYVLWTSIDQISENGIILRKVRSWWYSSEIMTDADGVALLKNTPREPESLLHSLYQATKGFNLSVNAN